jgi:hypothetical protein
MIQTAKPSSFAKTKATIFLGSGRSSSIYSISVYHIARCDKKEEDSSSIGYSKPEQNDSARFNYRQMYLVCTGPAAGPRFKENKTFFYLGPVKNWAQSLLHWGV